MLLIYFLSLESIPQRNQTLATIPVQKKSWKVSLSLFVFDGQPSHTWSQIFHCTVVGKKEKNDKDGSRTPALFLKNDYIGFRFLSNNQFNSGYDYPLVGTNKLYKLQILQHHYKDGEYKIRILVNNKEMFTTINKKPKIFSNVNCMLYGDSNNYLLPRASVSDFRYTSDLKLYGE